MRFPSLVVAALALAAADVSSARAAAPPAAPNEGRPPAANAQLKIETDLEYARPGGAPLRLDLYRMDPAPARQPVIVWIHGEGALDSKTASPAAGMVRPGGYAVASVEYRRGPGVTLATQLADVKAAIRWLRANGAAKDLDTDHIGVFGFGRGGQLAALAGVTADVAALGGDAASRVQAVVDVAGPVTSGGLDPSAYVTADDAPFLIVHGTADSQVSTQESQKLVSTLKVGKVVSQLDMPMGVGHDVGDLLSPTVMQSVSTFFGQHLLGQRVQGGLSAFVSTPPHSYVDPVALDLGGTRYALFPTPVRGQGTYGSYRIYLPPGYEQSGARRYPVIYFTHGRSVDSKRPITAGYIARADAAIRSGVMPPTIIVLVQGTNTGWYVDKEDGKHPMESVVIKDLIPYIDSHYRTIATREGRAIEGHSMGGYGAMHLGFKFPQLFSAVTGNAPANLDTDPITDGVGSLEYWRSQSIDTLATANAAQLRTQKIRIIIGDQDGLLPSAKRADESLTRVNVPHAFTVVPGSPHNHDQLVQYETFDTMAFYGDVFGRYRLAADRAAARP